MAAGLGVVGVGLQAYSMIKQGEDQADAAQKESYLKNLQADETEARGRRNAQIEKTQGATLLSDQAAGYTMGGVELSGSALLVMEDTASKIQQQVYDTYHESRFRADMLRQGANISSDLASDRLAAGYISAGGSILGGLGKAMSLWDPNTGRTPGFKTTTLSTGDGNAFDASGIG